MEAESLWKVHRGENSLEGASEVIFDHNSRKIEQSGLTDYDLFPYKMADQNNFYFRKHPKGINPTSYSFINYWTNFSKDCIEGKWIEEEHEDGTKTWVYMMPKLLYYINYVEITGTNKFEKRVTMKPDLSSVEWIQFSYIMCADGFSGFTGDNEYTCNRLVHKLSRGEELSDYEKHKLYESGAMLPNKETKIYVDPWEYLSRFYLVDNPRGDLGKPLYHNRKSNVGVFGARGVAKSYIAYAGDFMHMFTFGDVTNFENKANTSEKKLFAMGCGTKDALNRSIRLIKTFYDNQPGQYRYETARPKYMGPLYKKAFGTWAGGQEIEHKVKTKQDSDVIVGSSLQMNIITPDRTKIAAGDRFLRLYFEEAGFLKNLQEVHAANKDSMKEGAVKVGGAYYTGTSGDLETVAGIKALNDNPRGYDMMPIPNYWKNQTKDMCLFLSAIYQFRQFKDKGGNNDLHAALKYIAKERVVNVETMDSIAFDKEIMYGCIHPDEMLRPNKRSFLPSKKASERLSDIEAYDYFKIHATAGNFKFSQAERYGVEFKRDLSNKIPPILEYNIDRNKINLEGIPIVFEHPPDYIPDYLYWVIYDPVAKPGQGESIDASLNSIIVYKYFFTGQENTLEDCIVAEWIGRHEQLDTTYELVVKIAKYYNAMIFPETNTSGFVDWCKRNSYSQMLQKEANLAMKEINPNYQNKKGKVGFSIYGDKMKPWLLQKLRGWLLRKRGLNKETGDFESRTIEHLLSPRILNEIVNFSEKGNFDHISSLLGLMLLTTQLDSEPPNLVEEKKEEEFDPRQFLPKKRKSRSRFEQSIY